MLHAHRAHRTRRTRRAPQAEKDAAAAEEEYLRDALAAILQTEVEELRLGLQKRADELAREVEKCEAEAHPDERGGDDDDEMEALLA